MVLSNEVVVQLEKLDPRIATLAVGERHFHSYAQLRDVIHQVTL
jgi:hypothetical protein